MNAEYIQIARNIKLAGGTNTTIVVESGTPYRHLTIYVDGNGKFTIQPMLGTNDIVPAVNVNGRFTQKVYQMGVDEIMPATRGLLLHPDDEAAPIPLKYSLKISNTAAAAVVSSVNVFICAAASPGGA